MKSISQRRSDFDAIAGALTEAPHAEWLTAPERFLLEQIPPRARRGLDVGCGDGLLTRAAARRGIAMLGIDLSPAMIALAKARSAGPASVEYRVADVMSEPLAEGLFDVVLSVNTVHHLPLSAIVPRLAALVAEGGTLLVQDVVTRGHWKDLPVNVAAGLWRQLARALEGGRETRALRRLYQRHGEGERYLTPKEAEDAFEALLPGARVSHQLEWRYTVVWRREAASVPVVSRW